MAESVLSVRWKEYTSELATVYKSLLENHFLVDCTISAEGQSLKAHRLVLSACSPYFHMLFREETGKHTFVILLDASFKTLKAVIDFVYQGETQIPQGNLKAFLTLAQSLQIKGLKATQDYKNKNQSHSPTENMSCNGQCENMPSAPSMNLLQEHKKPHCDESEGTESTIKDEPSYAVFSEERNEKLDKFSRNEAMMENFISELDSRTSMCGEENLNRFSMSVKQEHQEDFNETSHGNVELLAQEEEMQLSYEASSGQDVAEPEDPLLLANLAPEVVNVDDEEDEDDMDDTDMTGNDANETYDEPETVYGEQNPDHCARADGLPPENGLANPQRSGHWESRNTRKQMCKKPLWPTSELQLQPDPYSHSGARADLGEDGGIASPQLDHRATRKRFRATKELHCCEVCGNGFAHSSSLDRHMRCHTGERPFLCSLCDKSFFNSSDRSRHMRCHTGERPFRCSLCDKSFFNSSDRSRHMRCHTGERPYRCHLCDMGFTQTNHLHRHIRSHTEERP